MAPPLPLQQQSPKQETSNFSMEHFLNTTTNTSHHQLQQQQYSYMGFNPFSHLYQQDLLFQENTNNPAFLASFNEVPQESFTSLVYSDEYDDPFCYFHNEGHGFSEEGGYNNNNGIVEYLNWEMGCNGKELSGSKSKNNEKQRREDFRNKYSVLMNLLPNRTKGDRASVVGGAIEYIKELLQTVNHLKLLLDKKKRLIDRTKKLKTEPESVDDSDTNLSDDHDQFCNGSLRSSWLQRKSKDTEVDVKVVNDEVNIKLVQLKKSNCLISVSKILDELQLDVHHVAGGCVGDFSSFMFNTKLYEGSSSVHASAIANKLIEGVGTDNAHSTSVPPSFC